MRKALVSSITILDQHPNIDEYKGKIRHRIRPSVHIKHLDSLYERLEGWWFDKTVQHLLGLASTPWRKENSASISTTAAHFKLSEGASTAVMLTGRAW